MCIKDNYFQLFFEIEKQQTQGFQFSELEVVKSIKLIACLKLKNAILFCLSFLLMLHYSAVYGGTGNTNGDSSSAFMENKGQWPAEILYKAGSIAPSVYFLKDGVSFGQPGEEIENADGTEDHPYLIWNMKFVGQDPAMTIVPENGAKSKASFLYGKDRSKWVIHPMEYSEINYNNIYRNTDLHFYSVGKKLKYDFIVKPGGNINSIKASYEGVKKLGILSNGDLEIQTHWHTQLQKAPVGWQIVNGIKQAVSLKYILLNDTTFGFKAENGFNNRYELVIDPLFEMVWASYTGATGSGNNINYCFHSATDLHGNVYLTGMVDATYPTTPGAYSGPGSVVPEIFVSKFSADGSTLLYSTYISGSSTEMGLGIAVDNLGRACITGFASANFTGGNTYPTTPDAYQPVMFPAGGDDVILTVLNSDGSDLVYSTFLGGSNSDMGYDIKIGGDGMIYLTGFTSSAAFPVKAFAGNFNQGNQDVFVAKFDISQVGENSLIYSVRIGGDGQSKGRSIAVNQDGNAFITGMFLSTGATPYPTTAGAFSTTYNSGADNASVVVTKLSASIPVDIEYSTFIGPGIGSGIDVNIITGEAFVTGTVRSFNFPVTSGALQEIHGQDVLSNPNDDAFVCKLNSSGSALLYSTYIGGPREDEGTGIVINSSGEAYVCGRADDDFPTSPGAFQQGIAGSPDFFLVHIDQTGTGYACGGSTLIGGSGSDYNSSQYDFVSPVISLNSSGGFDSVSISGTSHSLDFPTTAGSYEPDKINDIGDQPVFFKMTCITALVPPVASISSIETTSCTSASVNFSDNSSGNPTSWQWLFPGGLPASSAEENPQEIIYSSDGNYDVQLIACNNAGCDTTLSIVPVSIPESINVELGNDTTFCSGDSVLIAATAGFDDYHWTLNGAAYPENSNSFYVSDSGIYAVSVFDGPCAATDEIIIGNSSFPIAEFEYSLLIDCDSFRFKSVNLSQNALEYFWNFGDGETSTEAAPTHNYVFIEDLVLSLVASNGNCSDTAIVDDVLFQVMLFDSIPNVFTPNNDGVNDCFDIEGIDNFSGCVSTDIYNRWGEHLFNAEEVYKCWNGKDQNGVDMPDGVYFYVITINTMKRRGTVQLLR